MPYGAEPNHQGTGVRPEVTLEVVSNTRLAEGAVERILAMLLVNRFKNVGFGYLVAPGDADVVLLVASMCLLAVGNAGRGSFGCIASCKRDGV